jgi:LuxR family maltose regulon positive regulatory protein
MLELLRDAASTKAEAQHEMVRAWASHLLERVMPPVDGPVPQQSLLDPLSRREVEVLQLLDSELTGPQIAGELYVSLNTLRTHTKRIFTKLDVQTRAAAVRRAHERGLI